MLKTLIGGHLLCFGVSAAQILPCLCRDGTSCIQGFTVLVKCVICRKRGDGVMSFRRAPRKGLPDEAGVVLTDQLNLTA